VLGDDDRGGADHQGRADLDLVEFAAWPRRRAFIAAAPPNPISCKARRLVITVASSIARIWQNRGHRESATA
jgi:hypothetical protein